MTRYGPHIVRSIQRRFRRQKLRVLYGTEDCMQSVWGSVFCNLDKIAQMESPAHLMRYLAKVASNKLVDQDRHLHAQRNDVERDCPLPGSQTADRFGLASPGPTPSAQVAAKDEWEQKTKGLSIEQRTILELRAMGHTSEEIAEKTEYSGRGIRRILDQLSGLFFVNHATSLSAWRTQKSRGLTPCSNSSKNSDCVETQPQLAPR